MRARRTARVALAAFLAALTWYAAVPGPADARGPMGPSRVPPDMGNRAPRSPGMGEGGREPGWRERPPAMRDRVPQRTNPAQPGRLSPEKIERWRRMSPEEQDRIRERYRQWKALPPERRERLMERTRRWRELPEGDRRYLMQRREMYRNARPEQKQAIDKFVVRWRQLPPDRRRELKSRIAEWRGLPAAERGDRMQDWSFYRRLRPDEQRVIRWYLFSEPPPPPLPRE